MVWLESYTCWTSHDIKWLAQVIWRVLPNVSSLDQLKQRLQLPLLAQVAQVAHEPRYINSVALETDRS
jgi:hypothetical protein